MCWHKWGKWEYYSEQWERLKFAEGKTYPFTQNLQKRYCEKCNKIQVEKVDPL